MKGDLDKLTARDLMKPGVVTIVDDAPILNGFRAMAAHGTHAILVVSAESGGSLGWVTDRSLLAHLENDTGFVRIRDAITEEPASVPPGTTARGVASALSYPGTTHVLVASAAGRTPEGVISAIDLVRALGAG